MTGIPRGWKVKRGSETSHYYTDLRLSKFEKSSSCNQVTAALEDLRDERTSNRRCNLCEAKDSSQHSLASIRKAWDTSD